MAKADPKLSEGARLERKAVRAYLQRQQRALLAVVPDGTDYDSGFKAGRLNALETALGFVRTRQERYDAKTGGLGRKRARR